MSKDLRRVTVWDKNGLHVWAYRSEDGDLHIDGQHLYPGRLGDEYEYFLTVPLEQVALVEAALPAAEMDILDRIAQHGEEIVHRGEKTWLQSIGVKPRFFCMSR